MMGIFGTENIKIAFTLDSVDYEKILNLTDYEYKHDYNKKLLKIRRNIRTGARKQVFKGNDKNFTYSLFNISKSEWEGFYSKLKSLNNIKVFTHYDISYPYECYLENIEFSLYTESTEIGKIDFVFKSNSYKDTRVPGFIIQNNILTENGILLTGYYLNGDKI